MAATSVKRYVIERVVSCLPPTRLFRLKVHLYRWADVQIANSARVVSSVSILGPGTVSIGADTFIGHQCLLVAAGEGIEIGKHVDIGPRVFIGTGTHRVDMHGPHSAGPGYSARIVIEDGVWIGAGTLILPGVRVGRKAVIAAGSVVDRDIMPLTVAAGVPCRPRKQWNPASGAFESQ
jgi:acetyltransferase-like isoleucine patch superfamily enzyme